MNDDLEDLEYLVRHATRLAQETGLAQCLIAAGCDLRVCEASECVAGARELERIRPVGADGRPTTGAG
jgi:hypothetical protein